MDLLRNLFSWIYPGQQPSEKVKPGDLIEISRKGGLYKHWALYLGENEVMHLVLLSYLKKRFDCSFCGHSEAAPTKAIFKQEKLEKVVGSDQWSMYFCLDDIYDAGDVQVKLKNSPEWKGTATYDLCNCEFMVTNWRCGKPESGQVKPGDLIEISRKGRPYQHWALCVSENEVIHIVLEPAPTKAIIKQEKLEKVVGSDQWRVNNSLNEKYIPRDIEVILEDARKMKDTEVPYDLLTNNCEHMVTNLRYGKPESRQVQNASAMFKKIIWLSAISLHCYGKKQDWKGRQRSSTGPTGEGGEMVSEVVAEPPHADTTAEGRQRSSTGPTGEGGETVSEVEAEPPHADTAAEPEPVHRQLGL